MNPRRKMEKIGGLRRLKGRWALFAAAAAAVVFLGACATAPMDTKSRLFWADFLPDGGDILGKLEVKGNAELSGALISEFMGRADLDFDSILERTDAVFFALSSDGSRKAGSFIILGKFPPGIVKGSLKKDSAWKYSGKGLDWWDNDELGLQIAVPGRNVIFVSDGKIEEMIDRFALRRIKPLEPEVRGEMEISDAVILLLRPERTLLRGMPIDADKFPLKDAWFTLRREEGAYLLTGVFKADTDENARKLAGLVKLMLVGLLRKNKLADIGELKNSLSVKTEGNYVRIGGLSFNTEKTLRLIGVLMPAVGGGTR